MLKLDELNNNPLFSILIANFNNGRYLQEAIDSVLAQTYSNWEVVLVDDKSTDNSFEIYEKYKSDKRFHIYFNKENKGCGFTKRRCCELANGELCGFLDPDDKLTDEALDVMVKEHVVRPDCSLVYSMSFFWNDVDGTGTVSDVIGPMENGEDFLVTSKNQVFAFASYKNTAYKKTSGIDSTLRSAVDVDLYFKLEEVGELHYVDKMMYYYRQTNPNSISIGVSKNTKSLSKYHMICSLNAFSRRIKAKSPLVEKNKEKYLYRMRWQMGSYKRAVGHNDGQLLKFCWWYWVVNRYSTRSLNHIRKILFV